MPTRISRELSNRNIPHFQDFRNRPFTTRQAQLLFAHLQVVYMDSNMMALVKDPDRDRYLQWGLRARRFSEASSVTTTCCRLIFSTTRAAHTCWNCTRCCQGEYVIFDTETTGLNVFEDDIVQIAAIKVNAGKITDRFNIILHRQTDTGYARRHCKPFLLEYERADKVDRKDRSVCVYGLRGDCTLSVRTWNMTVIFLTTISVGIAVTSLSLPFILCISIPSGVARIMAPRLKSHKLKSCWRSSVSKVRILWLMMMSLPPLSVLDHFLGIFAANMQQQHPTLQNNSAVAELSAEPMPTSITVHSAVFTRGRLNCSVVDELEQLYGTFIQKEWITANLKDAVHLQLQWCNLSGEDTGALKGAASPPSWYNYLSRGWPVWTAHV